MNEEIIKKKLRTKELIKYMDNLKEGESVFIYDEEVLNIRSLYLAMYRKGKRFMQTKQSIGYTLTRLSVE